MRVLSALSILKNTFGLEGFRALQLEIIEHVTGGQNALVVMPTGAGKSLCFQVPGMMMPGVSIVVSPLISLMQNQVDALKMMGIEAETINSSNSPEDNDVIWRKIRAGSLKFLYLSPEKLMTEQMLDVVDDLNINLFAIDEAHCISQWGAAFRPEYESLSLLHRRYPTVPIIALTATADQGTREQICEKIFSDDVTTYLSGFDRPNITLNVEVKNGWKQQLLRFLKGRENENGIVYCLSRKKTEEATKAMQDKGYNALSYHAGMSAGIREENLNRFMAEDNLIMVATIAFGMGIDKADIRFVFHTDLPGSPEAYYQEIGRAGRDGAPATAHMLYGMDDIRMRRMFIDNENAEEMHQRRSHMRLNSLLAYCETPTCRRVSLLDYFGDETEYENCGNCDLCTTPRKVVDATEAGQKMLSAIYRTGQSFGVGHMVDILTGKMTDRMRNLSHDTLPTFAVGKEYNVHEWKSLARQLMARGFINADMEYGSLKITDAGLLLLKGKTTFDYCPDIVMNMAAKGGKGKGKGKAKETIAALPDDAQDLFHKLKIYRKEIAAERSVPAYIIFSDKSLIDMAQKKPRNLDQFDDIFGVGKAKKKEFGTQFIEFINAN